MLTKPYLIVPRKEKNLYPWYSGSCEKYCCFIYSQKNLLFPGIQALLVCIGTNFVKSCYGNWLRMIIGDLWTLRMMIKDFNEDEDFNNFSVSLSRIYSMDDFLSLWWAKCLKFDWDLYSSAWYFVSSLECLD